MRKKIRPPRGTLGELAGDLVRQRRLQLGVSQSTFAALCEVNADAMDIPVEFSQRGIHFLEEGGGADRRKILPITVTMAMQEPSLMALLLLASEVKLDRLGEITQQDMSDAFRGDTRSPQVTERYIAAAYRSLSRFVSDLIAAQAAAMVPPFGEESARADDALQAALTAMEERVARLTAMVTTMVTALEEGLSPGEILDRAKRAGDMPELQQCSDGVDRVLEAVQG